MRRLELWLPPTGSFRALSFIRKGESRKLAGVLAGLVVLQKSAGGVRKWVFERTATP